MNKYMYMYISHSFIKDNFACKNYTQLFRNYTQVNGIVSVDCYTVAPTSETSKCPGIREHKSVVRERSSFGKAAEKGAKIEAEEPALRLLQA